MAQLFGEDISGEFDPKDARESVMTGVSQYMKPLMQKARGNLSQRGFGRYHAPTIEGQVMNPLYQSGAESVRRGLTDLHYKDENLALQKKQQALNRDKFSMADYYASEDRNTAKGKTGASTVLCTELYRQGLLPLNHIKADLRFLKYHCDKEAHANYLRWAEPVVEVMRKNKLVTLLIYPFIRLWSGYMKAVVNDTRIPVLGYLIHNAGVAYGKLYKNRLRRMEAV